tara:strand:+ start:462 stop:1700 length:1239 start_codon:yes stop_codon:yes gene_type:complete
MTGGLIQLVIQGTENMYLTGNPKMSYFKCVYRRHTNFSTEYIEEVFDKTADFGKTTHTKLARAGDLIRNIYIKIELPALKQLQNSSTWVGYVNGIGNVLLKDVSIEIGGQTIDRHDSQWADIWANLTSNTDEYHHLVGNYETDYSLRTNALSANTYYVPLHFWFNRHTCCALPLISLQYHEVVLNVEFRNADECVKSDVTLTSPLDSAGNALSITDTSVLIEYIFIDTIERKRFAGNSHEYLIDQVQIQTETIDASESQVTFQLNLFHPVKELFWVIQRSTDISPADSKDGNHLLLYSDSSNNSEMFTKSRVLLNGKARYAERNAKFFRLVQPNKVHSYTPDKHIHCYSFSLHPEKYQPSGACNFGRINVSELELKFDSSNAFFSVERKIKIYATNYNIFKVQSGLGGVVFS